MPPNLSASRAEYPLANVKQIEDKPQKVRERKKLETTRVRRMENKAQDAFTIYSPRCVVGRLEMTISENGRAVGCLMELTICWDFQ